MNKLNKIIILAVFLTSTFINFNSYAETNYPNTSIAIVDYNLIFSDSKAAKNAAKQLDVLQKKTEEEILTSDKDIQNERNKLIEQQSVIAPEAFELKAKDFEKKFQNYQVERQNKLRKLEGLLQKANYEILENVQPILESLSQELGVTIILEKSSVILSANNMDITEQVIKQLNKNLPKIKVSLD